MPKGQWQPPDTGNAPQAVKDMVSAVYISCRDKQYEQDPASIEDPAKKASCAKQAWGAVANAGWKQDAKGTWLKEEQFQENGSPDPGKFQAGFSDKPWASVDKSKLPEECFLIVGDPNDKSTWKLPYREGAGAIDADGMYEQVGPVNRGALRAILAVMGGARGGVSGGVPQAVQDKVHKLAKEAGIGESAPADVQENIQRTSKKTYRAYVQESRISFSHAQITEEKPDHFICEVDLINLEPPVVPKRGWSLNRRYYTNKALEDLARVMKNRRMMVTGHHEGGTLYDEGGKLLESWKLPNQKIVRGKTKIFQDTEDSKRIKTLIKEQIETPDANLISLSINIGADHSWGKADGGEGMIVEGVSEGIALDAVFDPGAGGSFKSVTEQFNRSKTMDLTELKEARPDLVKQIREEDLAESQKKEKDLQEENKTVKDELKILKEEKEQTNMNIWADEVIKESGLTEKQAKGLKEELVKVGTKEEMVKLVEARKDYLRGLAEELKIPKMTFDPAERKDKVLTETEKAMCKKLNVSEEAFQKSKQLTESGMTPQEAGISFSEEKKA